MADAFKCRNCGTVVDSPQNCPDCGESAMRPVSRGEAGDAPSVSDETAATSEPDDHTTTAGVTDKMSDAGDHPAASEGTDDTADTDDHNSVQEANAAGETADSGGLLQKLKSLFS